MKENETTVSLVSKYTTILKQYWFILFIILYLVIILTPWQRYKYSVTAPGFVLRGVNSYTEDKENRVLEFDKNGRHYKFVGSYEIIVNEKKRF